MNRVSNDNGKSPNRQIDVFEALRNLQQEKMFNLPSI